MEWCFLCYRVKNGVTGFSGFCNPETSKNTARYMMFSDYIIRKPHKHPLSSTNSKHVCNSHPSVLGHCYMFLIKNWIFGLLDRIAQKLAQTIRKNSRTMTPVEGTSYGTLPLKIQNSIV
ncbi:hypothetical protein MTR_4g077767 [Medicago truncatula]|uniref:Uncharacterized protein n=1 Tax=Medicago truncatula TaxID=3880 RepID=A0A072ULK3_MEDTR|nr:hypothetical protein MTR_4g077767 [Medicago truncatula]